MVEVTKGTFVRLGDSPTIDAFGRARVSSPETLFDYQAQYDAGALLWEDATTGSGSSAHNANDAAVDLTVTTASGDKVTRQTRQYIRYQPGKSQLAIMTFVMATGQANMEQRVGYFDDQNGIFLKETNGVLSIIRRTYTSGSAVNNEVRQAGWNVDPLTGVGPSGTTIDPTKAQIFFVDLEWLGAGRIRCGFVINGNFLVTHQFNNANILSSVYMTTANLPLRYEIENTGTVAAGATLQTICSVVISEGGFETGRGIPFNANTGISLKAVTTRVPVISIRPKATFNSIVNRGAILPVSAQGYAEDNGVMFEVVYNGTLTGASFASADDDSIVEVDTTASAISGGIVTDAFYIPAASQGANQNPGAGTLGVTSRLPMTLDAAGANPINLSLVATSLNATTNVAVTADWFEIR